MHQCSVTKTTQACAHDAHSSMATLTTNARTGAGAVTITTPRARNTTTPQDKGVLQPSVLRGYHNTVA